MKPKAFAAALFVFIGGVAFPVSAQQYSDDELIRIGNEAWQQRRCVRAGQYLFAYLLRNPPAVRNDPAYRNRLEGAISWCEENSAVYAESKGDKIGKPPHKQPQLNLAPPAAPSASAVQKRCDIYGTLAAAQSAASSANRCGYGGNRWNPSYEFHYRYCLNARAAEIFSETQTRQNLLSQCAP
ncbi:MAG: hypothetical protein ABJC61_09105 [Acidobacteriota bacterium]